MKSRARKSIDLVVAAALFLALSGTCALAGPNPNNAILNGTYKAVSQDAGFSQGIGWLNAQLSGDNGTLTFDGAGNCTATFAGKSYGLSIGIQNPSVNIDPNNDPTIACTYDVNSDGSVSLTHPEGTETFYTNPAGTVILDGGAEERPGDQPGVTDYQTSQFVAIKVAAAPVALQGTFHAVSQDAGFWEGSGWLNADLYGSNGTLTFNGTGGCSFSFANTDYNVSLINPDGTVNSSTSNDIGTCKYATAADGKVTVTIGSEINEVVLGSDGNVILQGGAREVPGDQGGTGYEVAQMVAVKAGSNMTRASLQGVFHMVSQDAKFWSSTGGTSVNLSGDKGTLSFDGAGVCSYNFVKGDYSVPLAQNPAVFSSSPEPDSGSCSYAVALNGKVSLTHPEGTETFWLSADGMTLISGGARKQLETGSTGYEVTQMVGVKISPYVGEAAGPASVTVPAVDPDGNYTVSWAAEPGVTYVLEEAKDPAFLTGLRTAYRGLNLSANITYRPKGQSYYYRVRGERTGYSPSQWLTAANPCNVGTPLLPATITVPPSDADGSYTISWKASLTPDVTYVVEEATDSAFVTAAEIYRGSEISVARVANATGTIYFYRITLEKSGFPNSLAKKALNPCKVGLLSPAAITVPSSAGPGYEISWDASQTAGVTYKLQEATNAAFTTGLRTLSTPNTSIAISNRIVGRTYYYRVRAVKLNYPASPWETGDNGCLISNVK